MGTNHLKNRDAQRKVLTIAFGRWAATGHLCWSKYDGTNVLVYSALGEGEWNACKGAYYRGQEILPADYTFHPGALATGLTTGPQQIDSRFPLDIPHSRTAAIGYKIPSGLANADTANNPPDRFKGIFETKKCPNYNSAGTQTDFSYSTNAAREIIELLKTYARLPNLPSIYASAATYWLSRIDWGNWVEFRDFHDQTETVNYTTLADFDGFGLTAAYYSGTNFQTLAAKFVNANFDLNYGSQAPASGIAAGNFSAKYEGFIKFPFSETFTIYITHDNGARLTLNGSQVINQWQDDGTSTPGAHSATFNATANAFVPILAEWNDTGSSGHYKIEWESASQARQVIPSKYLYPKAESQKLYEVHINFDTPIAIGAAIRQILFQCNSIMQDVNGKLRFYCLEQLTPSFALDESKIDKFEFRRRDILQTDPLTEYEAQFNDLDSQYLEEPKVPVSHKLDIFTRQSFENVKVINLYNTTRWRARKVLQTRAKLETRNDLVAEVKTKMAQTYSICAGDLISVQHRKLGDTTVNCLVKEAIDGGVAETNENQGADIESRQFVIQEWT
jgi:hypothetical protein